MAGVGAKRLISAYSNWLIRVAETTATATRAPFPRRRRGLKKEKTVRVLLGILALGLLPMASSAAPLYSNDFEVDTTASWTVNKAPVTTDSAQDFYFDYSTVGIPLAPNSRPGPAHGLKLQANQSSGVFGGVSVSPTGQSFTGDYTLKFDWWANVNGPFPIGGSGSTQLSTYGIGTTGTAAQWPGGLQHSVWFAATGDGNSSADWRAYSTVAQTSYPDSSTVYAAAGPGNRNQSHPYYAGFGGVTAPAAQLALYPQQTGITLIGSAGMQWHQVEIKKLGNSATWTLDGTLIATIDLTTVTLAGGNIFFGHADTNATSSTDVNDSALLFTLVDNVEVVPEPGSLVALGAGVAAFAAQLRRGKTGRRR